MLLVGGGVAAILRSNRDVPTKLGQTADLLAGGAFMLAVLAAVVAIFAYRVMLLKPDLRADVQFGHGVDGLTLFFDPPDANGIRKIAQFIQCDLHVRLYNYGRVSARNPAVKVKLLGMWGLLGAVTVHGDWVPGDHRHGLGFTSVQWDGGADYSIHAKWGRDLPLLGLYEVRMMANEQPAIHLEIVADGFANNYQLPVTFRTTEPPGV